MLHPHCRAIMAKAGNSGRQVAYCSLLFAFPYRRHRSDRGEIVFLQLIYKLFLREFSQGTSPRQPAWSSSL
ncbi:MAG: hypothetical protein KatS3mg111_3008 [Pirellulaceae bacterium]|nr:MAG: hypothetical protein KatS3mg111_3008 [Pirellulaceae bacterium]